MLQESPIHNQDNTDEKKEFGAPLFQLVTSQNTQNDGNSKAGFGFTLKRSKSIDSSLIS